MYISTYDRASEIEDMNKNIKQSKLGFVALILIFVSIILFFRFISFTYLKEQNIQKANELFQKEAVIIKQDDDFVIKAYYEVYDVEKCTVDLKLKILNATSKNLVYADVVEKKTESKYNGLKINAYRDTEIKLVGDIEYSKELDIEIYDMIYDERES